MKARTHWKRIKAEAGFTLVELIVVIAILGILGGVGGVSYNGYVQKANQAADNILLDSVNSAFAAACLTDHKDAVNLPDDEVSVAKNLVVSEDGLGSLKPTSSDAINAAFEKYTEDFKNSPWKYYSLLTYSNGVYQGSDKKLKIGDDGSYQVSDGKGNTITVSAAARDNLKNSTYGKTIGIEGLASNVSDLVGIASDVLNNVNSIQNWSGMNELAQALGFNSAADMNQDQIANAVVLYTAQALAGIDSLDISYGAGADDYDNWSDQAWELIDCGQIQIMNCLPDTLSDNEKLAVQAAMNYAISTAYANSEYGQNSEITVNGEKMSVYDYYTSQTEELKNSDGGMAAVAAIGRMNTEIMYSDSWEDYLLSGTATQDINAFMSTMNALSDNVGNIDGQTYANEGVSGDYMSEVLALLFK